MSELFTIFKPMNCADHYTDYLVQCPEGIKVNAVANAGPYAALRWQLTDKFNHEYTGEVITNGDGGFTIPVADLPEGFLTPFSGDFELKVLDIDNDGRPVPLLVAGYFDAIRFNVKGGTSIKDSLGASFGVVLDASSGGLTNDYFTGDGTSVAYQTTTAFVPGNEQVFVGGLLYSSEEYEYTGANEITFNDPVGAGIKIRIVY